MPESFLLGVVKVFKENAACEPIEDVGPASKDALTHYGLVPSQPNLYAMLLGLGMRESSGRYCCGLDAKAGFSSAAETEAGIYQFSYNSIPADYGTAAQSRLRKLYALYKANPDKCDLETFKPGIRCSDNDFKNHGTGEGYEFQKFTKACPAFATRYAAVLVRVLRAHFGPLNRREVEVKKSCVELLSQIQAETCLKR